MVSPDGIEPSTL